MSKNVIIRDEAEEFNDFDREFGNFLLRYSKCDSPELLAAGMLLTRALRNGETRLDLGAYAGKTITFYEDVTIELPPVELWRNRLTAPELCGIAAPANAVQSGSLLLFSNDHTLMLRRYWKHENDIAAQLIMRRKFREFPVNDFPRSSDRVQDLAVFTALNSSLTILTGGPGTGKTTVCGRMIREILLREPDKNILFAAPTGKAQQRLASQISSSAELLEKDSAAYRAMKAIEGATIHSFLSNRQWYSKLALCDLLIVDECSMIPVELFSELLKIVPPACSLILAGDRRQLPPVESGTIFADICSSGKCNVLLPDAAEVFNAAFNGGTEVAVTGDFSGFIVELQTNYRSAQAPTICRIAELLRNEDDDVEHTVTEIVQTRGTDYTFVTLDKENYPDILREKCRKLASLPALCSSGKMEDIEAALKLSEAFHFLCAVNRGEQGCENVNKIVLEELDLTPALPGAWKAGTVLLVKVNDYRLGLRNGDIGIVTSECDDRGGTQIFCRFHSCPERRFAIGELPEHECGFAISIHKAQGSGCDEAVVILPGYNSPVLRRKLIYTGITRASKKLELWGTPEELHFALEQTETSSANLFHWT